MFRRFELGSSEYKASMVTTKLHYMPFCLSCVALPEKPYLRGKYSMGGLQFCREFQYCCYKEFEPSKTSTSLSLECCELAEQTTVQRLAPVEVQVYCRTVTSLTWTRKVKLVMYGAGFTENNFFQKLNFQISILLCNYFSHTFLLAAQQQQQQH